MDIIITINVHLHCCLVGQQSNEGPMLSMDLQFLPTFALADLLSDILSIARALCTSHLRVQSKVLQNLGLQNDIQPPERTLQPCLEPGSMLFGILDTLNFVS